MNDMIFNDRKLAVRESVKEAKDNLIDKLVQSCKYIVFTMHGRMIYGIALSSGSEK